MKFHFLLLALALWWALGSIHTAAMTAANVLVNRNLTVGSKFRYVVVGGPPVWLICIFCVAVAGVMSGIHRWKHRHVQSQNS